MNVKGIHYSFEEKVPPELSFTSVHLHIMNLEVLILGKHVNLFMAPYARITYNY